MPRFVIPGTTACTETSAPPLSRHQVIIVVVVLVLAALLALAGLPLLSVLVLLVEALDTGIRLARRLHVGALPAGR